ncbi:MAG: hypothetical protein LBG83_08960 [Oscillospiraceae bacterium]|jgi:hypothetical protein|nr:hypothetical protein [Oscillospiraceae bacterium]
MTKKLIAFCLALISLLALLSGCEGITLGQKAEMTTDPVNALTPDLVPSEVGKLTDEERKAWEEELKKANVLPPDVTIPATKATVPQPATMPAGKKVQPSEAMRYVKKVQDIIKSHTFYLKGNMNNPVGNGNGSYAPAIMAANADRLMVETVTDWTTMFKEMSEDAEQSNFDQAQALIQGAIAQKTFGSKMRMLFLPGTAYLVLPEKNFYTNLSAVAGDDVGDMATEILKQFSSISGSELREKDLKSSKVTMNGKEYLCATMPGDDGMTIKFYFLKGELKRLEYIMEEDPESNMVVEVEEFSGKVDPSSFELKGLKEIKVGEFTKLMGGFNSLLAG